MRARRAFLYTPGDDLHKIRKATTLGVDSLCLDLEDGVALERKTAARATVAAALRDLDFSPSERLVRINPVGSGFEEEDLAQVLPARPQGFVIPKVEYREQIRWVSDQMDIAEQEYGWPAGGLYLIAIIETARAIVELPQLASADPRLVALIFGAEDFASDVGALRTPQGWEVFYARSAVVTHASAYDLQAIDMVYVDFHDTQGLLAEARQGAEMGFAGKQVIHPDQVAPVQAAFTPSQAQIEDAQRLLSAYQRHQRQGVGAFALDGKMVDAPMVKAAQRVLSRARAAGIL